jgi:predicted AAA+ superfamily ATPase
MERDGTGGLPPRTRGLAALRGVLDSSAARDFLVLMELLAAGRPEAVAETFGRLWEELALEPDPLLPDAWQSHVVGRLLDGETPFALGAERGEVSQALAGQASRDLRTLQELFDLEAQVVLRMVESAVPALSGVWVPWRDPGRAEGESPRHAVARKLAAADDWGDCTELLAGYFTRHGAGGFGRYRAFRWRGDDLQAVAEPDPVRLVELVGYEREREPLLRNTERFLAGLPAHHALLYGLPGTGKSSTVKAVLNEYAERGLRLVEVAKEDLGALPRVLDTLRGRGPRFILFVDDLSFEEHEVEYKSLKALLEGSIERPPENVRVYATSNRRNLVRELFSEREDDVHARDTLQEKLSLGARFGLRVTFPIPDQRRYLVIVAELTRQRGMDIPEGELVERATLWDRWHAGRSGRTARQFVDELEAELGSGTDLST